MRLRHAPLLALALAACGPGVEGSDDDDDAPCDGCVCQPGDTVCVGDDVVRCGDDGQPGELVESCAGDQVCAGGECMSACAKAERDRSNVGCEYWAVDLDNEYSQFNDAAGEQFAIALANTSDHQVSVTVAQNDAAPGAPLQLSTVATSTVAPGSLTVIELPRREVDGSLQGQGEGPGTMLSSRAYRVTTDYPVVAYQFNPIVQSFSNGASLLIPTSGLDAQYHVLGWPTANPVAGPFEIPGIPDHSFVTVVGVGAPVHVAVTLGGPIVGGGGIPAAPAGTTIEVELGAFDVLNLESDGVPGDLTGTRVSATGPVAVFSGGERGIVPYDVMPPAPTDWDGDVCCTEHFEQQVFPTTALGKEFVTTRSPIRSTSPSNPEADVWRVLATEPGTVVTTSLPAPYDRFDLGANQYAEFWSIRDFVLSASAPVIVAQYLVSQQYVESPDVGGDPEFIVFPPAEQYRTEYIFLAPPTFDRDWCVIAAPAEAAVTLDGAAVGSRCTQHPAGTLAGVAHVAYRCPLSDGVHRVDSDLPVGVTVYGYYNVGSYGYPAGADVKRINVPD